MSYLGLILGIVSALVMAWLWLGARLSRGGRP
jgi:hypothetical protein